MCKWDKIFSNLALLVNVFIIRTVDILSASLCLLISLPLWIIFPILIKIDSKGPALYRQIRVGKNRRQSLSNVDFQFFGIKERRKNSGFGKPIYIYKFRTMKLDAEKLSGPNWAQKRDSRITRIGIFMRKSRLDEIPQLWNVLKGDMSFVGPRPERPFFVAELTKDIEAYSYHLLS